MTEGVHTNESNKATFDGSGGGLCFRRGLQRREQRKSLLSPGWSTIHERRWKGWSDLSSSSSPGCFFGTNGKRLDLTYPLFSSGVHVRRRGERGTESELMERTFFLLRVCQYLLSVSHDVSLQGRPLILPRGNIGEWKCRCWILVNEYWLLRAPPLPLPP